MSRRHPRRKTGSGRFARLPLTVLEHVSVTTLSHATFRVLILLAAQFTGYSNGALGITKNQALEQGIANRTLYRALRTLEDRGLTERTYHASRTPPRPTMYALAWLPIDDTAYSTGTRLPSRAWLEWKLSRKSKSIRKPKLSVVGN